MKALNSTPPKLRYLPAAVFLLLTSQLCGCLDDSWIDDPYANQPPTVWLSSAPPEGSISRYTIHMYWGGWDPDGEILYYEYAITDNDSGYFDPADTTGSGKWHRVWSNDSTFTFTADQPADTINPGGPMAPHEFIRSHTFFLRAVDDQDLSSEKPAYRSFTATTLSPEIKIIIPVYHGLTPALVPPVSKISWLASDYIDGGSPSQEPDSVRWILLDVDAFEDEPFPSSHDAALNYIRRNPTAEEWYPWHYYRAPNDEGKSWTTPPLDYGRYMFAVQAKDEAGAVTPVFDEQYNVRRMTVTKRPMGPLLTVWNEYIGTITSVVAATHYTIVDLAAGLEMIFCISATSESYGGVVVGYRYGWDVLDFSDDDQWACDWTPFIETVEYLPPEVFYFGSHSFHVEAMDNSGYLSRVNIRINFIPLTMERDLLIVDDYYENPISSGIAQTSGAIPSDQEHDQFWLDMVGNLANFNPVIDVVEVSSNNPLSIRTLAQYKSVIWDAYSGYNLQPENRPFLYDLIAPRPARNNSSMGGKVQPNLLALFMAGGGHVLICGEQPMTAGISMGSPKFPFIVRYECEGDQSGNFEDYIDNPPCEESFLYKEMCLDVTDITYTGHQTLRNQQVNGCGVTHLHGVRPIQDGMRDALPIDLGFPLLTLRPECAGPGKFWAPEVRGLNAEMYNPEYFTCGYLDLGPRDCFEPIYGLGCLDQMSNLYNEPVAFWTSVFDTVPPVSGNGVGARSAVWGFEPVYFDPDAVREALELIMFDEWMLPAK